MSEVQAPTEGELYAARQKIYPREIQGRFQRLRVYAFFALLGLYYVLPWIRWGERQAVMFDLPARKFHIFGLTLWPQDFYLLTWLLVMAALSLFFFTALAGRLFCGYACPQTVWTEVFIWMERLSWCLRYCLSRLKIHDNPAGTDQAAFDKSAQAIKADRARFLTGFFRTFFGVGTGTSPVSQELLDWARGIAMQASLKATLECARSFSSTDFRGELPAFKVPTLIIHGTEDKTVPIDASSRAAAKGIAGRTLIEYEGAPHGLFATHKARLTKDLLDFIGR